MRRQHQRDAYADLVRAAHTLVRDVSRLAEGGETTLLDAKRRVRDLREEVDRAAAIAALEGPDHLITFIDTVIVSTFITEGRVDQFEGTLAGLVQHLDDDISTLESAASLFAQVARDYLNSGKRRRHLRARFSDENRRIRRHQLGG
ncbi:hypothetical protein [Streptomyces sp. NPDC005731]|uniref:hypothetical protein n=1 Tax=Streptomyces sp. NPDC005731 TaxID=3157056 RepID=UPI00340F19EF